MLHNVAKFNLGMGGFVPEIGGVGISNDNGYSLKVDNSIIYKPFPESTYGYFDVNTPGGIRIHGILSSTPYMTDKSLSFIYIYLKTGWQLIEIQGTTPLYNYHTDHQPNQLLGPTPNSTKKERKDITKFSFYALFKRSSSRLNTFIFRYPDGRTLNVEAKFERIES